MSSTVSDEFKPLLAAFNLEDFRVGRHVIRGERLWPPISDLQVESMWLATIEPSFDQMAYLMVVHTDKHPQAVFCLKGPHSLPDIPREPIDCPTLDDQVASSLKHIDLFSRVDGVSLDGIGYSVHICTSAASADLAFSSPLTESLCSVERGLFEVAASVAGAMDNTELDDYIDIWRRYCGQTMRK